MSRESVEIPDSVKTGGDKKEWVITEVTYDLKNDQVRYKSEESVIDSEGNVVAVLGKVEEISEDLNTTSFSSTNRSKLKAQLQKRVIPPAE